MDQRHLRFIEALPYRGTSLLWWPWAGGLFLTSDVPLQHASSPPQQTTKRVSLKHTKRVSI